MAGSRLISDGKTKVVINREISVNIPKGMVYSTESAIINSNASGVSRALVCIKEGGLSSLSQPYGAPRSFVVMEPKASLVQLDSGTDMRSDEVEGIIHRYVTMLLAIFGGEVVLHKRTADLLVYYKRNEEHRYQFAAVTTKNVYTGQIWVNDSDDPFNITKQWLSGIDIFKPTATGNCSEQVKSSRSAGLAEEIVAWFQQENTLVPLADIQAHFSSYSKTEVKIVLDRLCRWDVLFGGDTIIYNMYGLVSDEAAEEFLAGVVFDKPAKKTVKQEDPRRSRYEAAVQAYKRAVTSDQMKRVRTDFVALNGYLDADSYIIICDKKIPEMIAREEEARLKRERQAEIDRKDKIYANAMAQLSNRSARIEDIDFAISEFRKIPGWKDADAQICICQQKIEELKAKAEADRLERERQAEIARKDAIYNDAKSVLSKQVVNITEYQSAIAAFNKIRGWKDADTQVIICQQKIEELKAKAEADRLERERQAELRRAAELAAEKKRKKRNTILSIVAACVALVCVSIYIWVSVIIPNSQYNDACYLMEQGQYEDAIALFNDLDGYKDSAEQIIACENGILENKYTAALSLLKDGKYEEAYAAFEALGEYSDSVEQCKEARYQIALIHWNKQEYNASNAIFKELGNYKDSAQKIHIHDYVGEVLIAPGCETEGKEEFTCQSCPDSYIQPLRATGHSYGETSVLREPTCTEQGKKESVCSMCGTVAHASIPAKGHNYGAATCTTPKTCTRCAETTGSALGHSYGSATCTLPSTCSRCDATTGNALGHSDNGKKRCSRCNANLTPIFSAILSHEDKVSVLGNYATWEPAGDAKYHMTVKVLEIGPVVGWNTVDVHYDWQGIDAENVKVGDVFTIDFYVYNHQAEKDHTIDYILHNCVVEVTIEPID